MKDWIQSFTGPIRGKRFQTNNIVIGLIKGSQWSEEISTKQVECEVGVTNCTFQIHVETWLSLSVFGQPTFLGRNALHSIIVNMKWKALSFYNTITSLNKWFDIKIINNHRLVELGGTAWSPTLGRLKKLLEKLMLIAGSISRTLLVPGSVLKISLLILSQKQIYMSWKETRILWWGQCFHAHFMRSKYCYK